MITIHFIVDTGLSVCSSVRMSVGFVLRPPEQFSVVQNIAEYFSVVNTSAEQFRRLQNRAEQFGVVQNSAK